MTEPAAPLLRISAVRKVYGRSVVLNNLDLDVAAPPRVVLIGASGSGQSTRLRCIDLRATVADGGQERLSKKEALTFSREIEKLTKSIGGIKDMNGVPDAIFVIDVGYHKGAVTEAAKLGIPVIGVVDTNHSPDGIAYVIPGNDDSSKAIRLYARGIADAILEGRNNALNDIVETPENGEEFVEVSAAA